MNWVKPYGFHPRPTDDRIGFSNGARGRTSGAQVLGAVLTETTQAAVVHEAKQGKKREEGAPGDPPNKTTRQ